MINVTAKQGRRISLNNVFSAGLIGILLVFILLSYFTFTRLLSFESKLTEVSNNALPKLIFTSQLYGQAARLLEATALLSRASSDAAKRLAESQLNDILNNLRTASNALVENDYLDIQLDTISIELQEFSSLINQQFEVSKKIEQLTDELYDINNQTFDLPSDNNSPWSLQFSRTLLNAKKALNERRIQKVRFAFAQLNNQLKINSTLPASEPNKTDKQQLTDQLDRLLFSNNGLEALKVESLRLAGRAIGRENFVHNLIEDYVTQLSFVTDQTQQDVTQQVASSLTDMESQTYLIRYVLAAGIICLLLIFVIFQQRILKRLSVFTLMVRSEAQGFEYQAKLDGNDEITDLAEAFKEFSLTIEKQKLALEQLSMLDDLTGVANRRGLTVRLQHDIELAVREKNSLAVLLMDIDCFKLYNDNYGHIAGDECLKAVVELLQESVLRESDFIARYGGEEFICVLPNTNEEGAQRMAAHISEKFSVVALPHKYSKVSNHVTLSTGIVVSHPDSPLTASVIINQADKALYAAKKAGKNTHKLYSDQDM